MEAKILSEGYENDPRKNIHNIYVKEMIINPFAYIQPINYTMEAFVAPANFDPDAQELNIVKAFAAYPDVNKKYIFSVGTSTSTELPAVTGRSYAYSQNGGAYTTIVSGTVTWTVGSTKRNVVVIDSTTSVVAEVPNGGVWVYVGKYVSGVSSKNNQFLKYIHCTKLSDIKEIKDYAFQNCNQLSGSLNLPVVYSTGFGAFENCYNLIGNLIIPSGIVNITNSFRGCTGFTGNLTIPDSVIYNNSAFFNCTGLNGALVLPMNMTNVDNTIFFNCSFVGNLVLPTNLTTIGNGAFRNCHFSGSLVFPISLTYIGDSAFQGCSFFVGTLRIPNFITEIYNNTFQSMSGITELVLHSSVSIVNAYSFSGYNSLSIINCHAVQPPIGLRSTTFSGVNKTTCILHVPVGSLAAYQAAPYWNEFTNIIADL